MTTRGFEQPSPGRRAAPGRGQSGRSWLSRLGWLPWVVAGFVAIVSVRQRMADDFHDQPLGDDVSLLLSPDYTVLFSLGHREALADYLFSTLLVRYGISFGDKRPFAPTYRYLDTITTLAPRFGRAYLFADTLLVMLPKQPEPEAFERVRTIHDRGLEALPFFTELWSVAGQFAAYFAPPRVPPERREDMKLTGARLLARACELAGDNANVPYHCISAARIFNKAGQRDAMVRMLARTLAVQDDPRIREMVEGYMKHTQDVVDQHQNRRRVQALEAEWKRDLPHVSRNMMSLLGPQTDVWDCSGPDAAKSHDCASSWRRWSEQRFALPE